MGNIQVLSFEVANLIAAGEVVDRPASAIKEMMENAIDAGAKHITVEIQNGGVTFMRVTDDGCGMSAEDLPMAIRRHATSKIRNPEDLDGILTLGFRGEALAAISSVSDMRILSKRAEDAMGSMLEVRGGQILGVTEHGCRNGTTVIVENLFANVPARRKFLKRDATEAMAVTANVERVALSHPEIQITLISDGAIKLDTAGDGVLRSAIWAVFGRTFAGSLLELDSEHEGIRITGYVGRSDNVRANRNAQLFFINNRFVKSRTAQAALEQAFTSYLPPEKYPCCVMNIGLNPARVDVNVHPAKLEVKFSNEKPVFEAVYYAVRQALEQNTTRPEYTPPEKKPLIPGGGRVSDATAPVETERPASLGKRQIAMDVPTPAAKPAAPPKVSAPITPPPPEPPPPPPKPAATAEKRDPVSGRAVRYKHKVDTVYRSWERITAEDYVRFYIQKRKTRRLPEYVGNVKVDRTVLPPETPLTPSPSVSAPVPSAGSAVSAGRIATRNTAMLDAYAAEAEALFGDVPPLEAPDSVAQRPQERAPLPRPTLVESLEDTPAEADPAGADIPAPEPPAPMPADERKPAEEAPVRLRADAAPPPAEPAEPPAVGIPYRLVGEVFHSYVLVERGDTLLLIDKHAAHERIIFERLKAGMREKNVDAQLLLLPVEVMLMSEEIGVLDTYRAELEAVGFSYTCRRFSVSVDAIPSGIDKLAVPDMLAAIAEQLKNGVDTAKLTRDILFEKALYQASCKAAIKAGREYPPEHIAWLVDELMKLPDITFCPHGRPVAMEMTKRNIDHQFERC